jgi:hypothetical protein
MIFLCFPYSFISYELLRKTELTTDIVIKFEDNKIDKKQYTFIKDQLDDYDSNISAEYTTATDLKYDEIKQILLIGLIISIPDIRKPKNIPLEQIINEQSYSFIKFYERNIQIIKPKYNKES